MSLSDRLKRLVGVRSLTHREGEWELRWLGLTITRYTWGTFVDLGRMSRPRLALRVCWRRTGTWFDGRSRAAMVFLGRRPAKHLVPAPGNKEQI